MFGFDLRLLCLLFTIPFVLGRKDFSCSADEFECSKSQTCTRLNWRCDGEEDCFDGEDEEGCPKIPCQPGFFRCKEGRCIDESWVCDRHYDCRDKDDEAPIQKCNKTTCRPTDFQCRNGDCIQGSYRCDREIDCHDRSDEYGCPELNCTTTEFKCGTNLTCISLTLKCNGIDDCGDGSDEKNCPATCNPSTEFTCGNGECIPTSFRCDADKDCLDGSDELACPPRPTSPPCHSNQFQCGDGECVPLMWQCDGIPDCNNRADELDCPPSCSSTQFTCVTSGTCISQHSKCDGVDDCTDGSDEKDCAPPSLCSNANSFRCGSSSFCINNSKVCDAIRDCPGSEDEAPNCGIDECSDHNGHCFHSCRDFPIGYECYCNPGYKLSNDSRSCEDLDECNDVYGSCSQTCANSKGSFKCECVDGFRMETGATDTCRASGPQAYLVFANEHSIHNLTTSGAHYGVIASNLKAPIAVSHDLENGYVYWTDILDGKIERALMLGEGKVETVVNKVEHSNGLAIDWIGKKIYWTDETLRSIEVCELDGKNRLKLFSSGVDVPRGIAVDPFERYIFWTDWSGVHPKIERASMDGDSISRQIILDKDLVWPTALTLDTIVQRVFFVDTKSQRIETIRYDGSGRKLLVSKGLVHPLGLVVFEDRLYYTDFSLNTIYTIDKRTGQRLGELKKNLKRPSGISIAHPLHQKRVSTPCNINNGGCSHLCLLSSTSSKKYSCRCPEGMLLRSNGKSCTHVIEPDTTTPKPNTTTPEPDTTTPQPSTKPSGAPTGTRTSNKPVLKPNTKGPERTNPSKTLDFSTTSRDSPLAKKQEKASANPGPMIAGVTVGVILLVFLLIAAILYWRRRTKMADRSILFYKDNSRTPLQNDFDDDLLKSPEEVTTLSRVQFA